MDNENKNQSLRDVKLTSFSQLIGQQKVAKALSMAVDASFHLQQRMCDVLLQAAPGLGKSSMVDILKSELCVECTTVLSQTITNSAELNSVLLRAGEGLLFLDEIHLLNSSMQHQLLLILDHRKIFLNNGKRVTEIPVAPFTLIGATTNPEKVIRPLIDRFRMVLTLEYFSHDELCKIVEQRCRFMNWDFESGLESEIAKRSKDTPRIAIRLLDAARRSMASRGEDQLKVLHLKEACFFESIDSLGLNMVEQSYMALLKEGAMRLNVMASSLGFTSAALTDNVEPYLIRSKLIFKTDKGERALTEQGLAHVNEEVLTD